MTTVSYEIDTIAIDGTYPNSLTIKLFNKNLLPQLKYFIKHHPPIDFFLYKTSTNDSGIEYDEYWLEYRESDTKQLKTLSNSLNLLMWMTISNKDGIKRIAQRAAKQISGDVQVDVQDYDGKIKLTFTIDNRRQKPIYLPDDFMYEAASTGLKEIEDSVEVSFFNLIVTYKMMEE